MITKYKIRRWNIIFFILAVLMTTLGIEAQEIIGRSVEDRAIKVYRIDGNKPGRDLVIIGGIHGGYEWNTVVLAWSLLEYFKEQRELLPSDLSLHFIPVMNPDGLYQIAGTAEPDLLDSVNLRLSWEKLLPGRLNGNLVDLNRNFDNNWQPNSYHGNRVVNAGSKPFSEPETRAIRDYIKIIKPAAVIFLHSASNNIWYGGLPDNWEPAKQLAEAYSEASGYVIHQWTGGSDRPQTYSITGTASGYFYQQGLPAIIIELSGRYSPDLDQNIRGLKALIKRLPEE